MYNSPIHEYQPTYNETKRTSTDAEKLDGFIYQTAQDYDLPYDTVKNVIDVHGKGNMYEELESILKQNREANEPPKRRHKAQGSAPTQRVNLSLVNVAQADKQAAKMGLSRSAYVDLLIEKDTEPKVCNNCGCPNPRKTYDGYWCKMCHNEM